MAGEVRATEDPLLRGPSERGHEAREHAADARIFAWGVTLPDAFEEVAAGLSDLTADCPDGATATWHTVELLGRDLDVLVFAWLNELIGLAETERRAIGRTEVSRLRMDGSDRGGGWRLAARVGLIDFEAGRARALHHAKAAALHGLQVREQPDGWTIDAIVDL